VRIIETTEPAISQLKYTDTGDHIRLTFQWPPEIYEVYISREPHGEGRLYTLQEYRQQGGYLEPKRPGRCTWSVMPFIRLNGVDTYYARPDGNHCITCIPAPIEITYLVRTRWGFANRTHVITLYAKEDVPPDVVFYANMHGAAYPFGEALTAGVALVRHVNTQKGERIRLFVHEGEMAELYCLRAINKKP